MGTMIDIREWLDEPISGVIEEISPNEKAYLTEEPEVNRTHEHYFSVGQSAVRCIKLALLTAGRHDVRRVLDLPCGHGRVLRTLKAAFPEAHFTACDINQDMVDFCARTFGAEPVYSDEDPRGIRITGQFDLIWVGSLLTHLDSPLWIDFLQLFESLLSPDGVLVFTTGGREVVDRLRSGRQTYWLPPDLTKEMLARYEESGFAYGQYPWTTYPRSFGISIASPTWVCSVLERMPELRLLNFTERGWDQHQDVVACLRA